jgi:hypothetical protein
MSKAKGTFTTAARIRFPNEFLHELDTWAAAHGYPRSVAVRVLVMRGLMFVTDAAYAEAAE